MFRLNRAAVVSALEERARRVVHDRAEVIEVRLFGSLATGNAAPGSDADLLIVLDGSVDEAFPDRATRYAPFFGGLGIACDLFPYKETELARLGGEGNTVITSALKASVTLARRRAASAP